MPSRVQSIALAVALVGSALTGLTRTTSASCNQIPGTVEVFRGAAGSANRPFAGPGDFLELRAGTACHPAAGGFQAEAAAHVVSVVFTPQAGRASLVALAADCAAVTADLSRCSQSQNLAHAVCVPHADAAVESVERDGERRLRLRFPDTDALLHARDDDRTLTGPAALAVTAAGDPLPCDLVSRRCREREDLPVCIDALFDLDGTCGAAPHPQFPHFTALPPPNDFQALCVEPSPPCTGRQSELRFTTDSSGNLLLPVDWRGVLLGETVPVARLLRGATSLPAFPDGDAPIRIPGRSFLRSFSPNGGPLPPIFEPQADPSAPGELTLFGSADAAQTVLFIARRGDTRHTCRGGSFDGLPCNQASDCPAGTCTTSVCRDDATRPCTADDDCAGGVCGGVLFDFTSRAVDGVGPVVLRRDDGGTCPTSGAPCQSRDDCDGEACVAFRLRADDPVPLEGLLESEAVFVSVVPEAIADRDLNGDGDQRDDVVLLHDRRSGVRQPIGERTAPGRAATRLHQPPFRYPAVAAENDVVALLEAEPLQGDRDANGDGDRFDSILRVFRTQADGAVELTAGLQLSVEAAPLVSRRSVALSQGAVFFRTAEAAESRRRLRRVSLASTGQPSLGKASRPVLSGDGRHVAFQSDAGDLVAEPPAAASNIYLHDRVTGTTSVLRLDTALDVAQSPAYDPSLADDGSQVAAVVKDDGGVRQIVVHDRDTDRDGIFDEADAVASTVISVNSFGERGERDSHTPSLSGDGRFVAFTSLSSGLVREDPDAKPFELHARALLHDRDADEDGIFDDDGAVAKTFLAIDALYQPPSLSRDGTRVAFASVSDFLLEEQNRNDFCINLNSASPSCADPFVRDFAQDTTLLGSLSLRGEVGDNVSADAALAADRAVLSFDSSASNLVAGDTNGAADVFVRDLEAGTTVRVSVASDGTQANGSSGARVGALSADGRYVVFASDADNLVAGDDNRSCSDPLDRLGLANCTDVFRHDVLTGFTERLSIGADGTEGNGRSQQPYLAGDGTVVAFQSRAGNLLPGAGGPCAEAGSACADILVSEPDPNFGGDRNRDGDLADTVLRVLDTAVNPPALIDLGPAGEVDTAAGNALYHVPEAELAAGPDADRNRDGDTRDDVVHLWTRAAGAQSLRLAAAGAVLSESHLAILVPEADQGGMDRNRDGDTDDSVVCVATLASPAECINLARAADDVKIAGHTVAFLALEARQVEDLNRDGDLDDHVVHTYDAATDTLTNHAQAGIDLVVGPELVAFRTPESAQGESDLNGDGDRDDAVLQVIDVGTAVVINSRQAATPCRLEACDPRVPYRVVGASVRFLTLEAEQGADLNDDGDRRDLILQTLTPKRERGGGAAETEATAPGDSARVTALGAVKAGICSDTGEACAGPADCRPTASCYLPPGACVEDLGVTCATDQEASCASGQFCVPKAPGLGSCHVARGSCTSDTDCPAPALCKDAGKPRQPVLDPLAPRDAATFTGAGQCIEDLGRPCDAAMPCAAGEYCATVAGGERRCHREHGSCATEADCPGPSTCRAQLITAVARDSDQDTIPDPFDNCPRVANADQSDTDADRIGDACTSRDMPTPQPTIESIPTPTPHASRGDGCQVHADPRKMPGWMCLLPILVARGPRWLRRRTHRRKGSAALESGRATRPARGRWLVLLLAAAVAVATNVPPTTAVAEVPAVACAADCDGSGAVTVDEVTRLVSRSLGESPPSGCACADTNDDAAITVDELLSAVNDALVGCAALPPEQVARAALSLVRSLAYLPSIAIPVSLGLNGAGPNPEPCPIAGGFENSCSEPAVRTVQIPIEVEACELDSPEGRGVYSGVVDIVGRGSCPDVLYPLNIQMRTQLTAQIENLFSRHAVDAGFDLDILVSGLRLAAGPCQVAGADGTLAGEMRFRHADDQETTIAFDAAAAIVRLEEMRHDFDCQPDTIATEIDGSMTPTDATGAGRICAVADGLNVRRQRRRELLEVDGRIAAPRLGGAVKMRTVSPVHSRSGDLCLRSGELEVVRSGSTLSLRFEDDGSVRITGPGSDFVIDDFACGVCGDGRVEGGEECDDGNAEAGDGCSDLCVVESCHQCAGVPSHCRPAADGASCDDGLTCTGNDRCQAGACVHHEKPCLFVADRFAARVFAVDLEGGGARLVSDRNLLRTPGGLAVDERGRLLISDDDGTRPFRLLRIDPRTGAQEVVMESDRLSSASSLIQESAGTLILVAPRCCTPDLGSVFRIDPEAGTATLLFESPAPLARSPEALIRRTDDEWLVTYLDTNVDLGPDPGHLYRVRFGTGEQEEVLLDTTLIDPEALAFDPAGRLYLLDSGVDIAPHRLLRVDLDSGTTQVVATDPLFSPSNMVFAPDGTLLIADRPLGSGRVMRVDLDTGTTRQLVEPGRMVHPDAMWIVPAHPPDAATTNR